LAQSDTHERPTDGARTFGLLGLLIELVLPVVVSAALLLTMARYTSSWNLRSAVGLGVFGLLLVALSLFLSLRVDALTLAGRRRRGKTQLLNRADARSRLVKFVLGGVLVPIAAFAAANRVELPNRQTPMSMAIAWRLTRPTAGHAEQLANAVLRAESAPARVEGILALQGLASPEALDQLFRILNDDPAALRGTSEYQALSRAIASYGAPAKRELLQRWEQVSPDDRRGAASPPGDLFERYFSAEFEELEGEIAGRTADPAVREAEMMRLRAAQVDLKQALGQFDAETASPASGSRLPAFVMQTFLAMGQKHDEELLVFARRTAGDAEWSDPVRGQAMLLIAKLGAKEDLDGLFAYLESSSPSLRARALQAIFTLQSRLSHAGPNG
jgi:hypothetical protein